MPGAQQDGSSDSDSLSLYDTSDEEDAEHDRAGTTRPPADPIELQARKRRRALELVEEAEVLRLKAYDLEHPTSETAKKVGTGRPTAEALLGIERISWSILSKLGEALDKDPECIAATLALNAERCQAARRATMSARS